MLESAVQRLEQLDALDGPADQVASVVTKVTHQPPVSSLLSGSWLGHPLHPVLTDLPIGFWTSAFVLDLLGGKAGRRPAQLFVGLGVLTALPTAATGVADWADTVGGTRRVGAVHALVNSSALACYALSWRARRKGHHVRGVLLGMLGATAASVGAALGGHLVYRTGTGVDVNVHEEVPEDWATAEAPPVPLVGVDVEGYYVRAGDDGVLATRKDGGWVGIGARCSHRGGPLQEGTFERGCVTCPWHESRFRLDDGSVVTGPATAPQPRYDVRQQAGRFAIRKAAD